MSVKFKEKNDFMSTVISAKLGGEFNINPVEVERLNCANIAELFAVRQDKKNSLEYTGPLVVHMAEYLQKPINKHNLYYIVEQIVNALLRLQEKEFMWNNVCWSIDNVFVVEQTGQVKLIYLPINEGYDICRARDLIINIICSANISEDDTAFVSDFIQFINSQEFFDPQGIENYITTKDSLAVENVKTPKPMTFNSDALSDGLHAADDSEEETGLLVDEAEDSDNSDDDWIEETTLLNEVVVKYPVLLRIATDETVRVNKDVFRIGKNKHVVDFHVTNNKAVSREHLDVITRGGLFYVKDLESKNHTFINDQRIDPGVEYEIRPGDRLTLGNEQFIVQDPAFV